MTKQTFGELVQLSTQPLHFIVLAATWHHWNATHKHIWTVPPRPHARVYMRGDASVCRTRLLAVRKELVIVTHLHASKE